jgi:hypothetical protein
MGSPSQQFTHPHAPAEPDFPGGASGVPEARFDAADSMAIGYEAADPSLVAPQWDESLQGLPARRDRR